MSFTSSLFTGLDQFVSNIIYREAKGRFCVCFIKQWKHLFKTHRAHFWEPVRFSSPHDLVFHGASCLVLCLSGFFFFFFWWSHKTPTPKFLTLQKAVEKSFCSFCRFWSCQGHWTNDARFIACACANVRNTTFGTKQEGACFHIVLQRRVVFSFYFANTFLLTWKKFIASFLPCLLIETGNTCNYQWKNLTGYCGVFFGPSAAVSRTALWSHERVVVARDPPPLKGARAVKNRGGLTELLLGWCKKTSPLDIRQFSIDCQTNRYTSERSKPFNADSACTRSWSRLEGSGQDHLTLDAYRSCVSLLLTTFSLLRNI